MPPPLSKVLPLHHHRTSDNQTEHHHHTTAAEQRHFKMEEEEDKALFPYQQQSNNNLRKQAVIQNSMRLPEENSSIAATTLEHSGTTPSIKLLSPKGDTPWTPKSLHRAKTAIVYKETLNDTLMVLESWSIFFKEWKLYFVSLQSDYLLLFKTREDWEQGKDPAKVIRINHLMLLSEINVEVEDDLFSEGEDDECHEYQYGADGTSSKVVRRLFRRKLLETDEFDQWLNHELKQSTSSSSISTDCNGGRRKSGSYSDTSGIIVPNDTEASASCVLEFGAYTNTTFELWSKALKATILRKTREHNSTLKSREEKKDEISKKTSSCSSSAWVTPGHDCKISMHQSEVWVNRVLADDRKKANSEMRRLVAMENLVDQITSDNIALLVYQKVSRVTEMFTANARREMESSDDKKLPDAVLNFFCDHLKRKYSVFLSLALSSNLMEEDIREAHEIMCKENSINADTSSSSSYGFDTKECIDLYSKYRVAAKTYYEINYGDASAAEEEDAIMHLPVTLYVALLQGHDEEAEVLCAILNSVKERLETVCDKDGLSVVQEDESDETTT